MQTAWLTLISENDISDDLYARVREHFDEQEILNPTMAVVTINSWNRLAIPFGGPGQLSGARARGRVEPVEYPPTCERSDRW